MRNQKNLLRAAIKNTIKRSLNEAVGGKFVYLVLEDNELLFGLFSSREKAQEAVMYLKDLHGDRSFTIQEEDLDIVSDFPIIS